MASARTNYDNSNCVFNLCCFSGPGLYNIVREGYGIEGKCVCCDAFCGHSLTLTYQGSCVGDICVTLCCPCCSATRVYSETMVRGPVATQTMRR